MLSLVLTDANQTLSPSPPIAWTTDACPATGALSVDVSTEHQTIGGFGASLTESSAINLNALPPPKQAELLELLFGASGARLSAVKATMLANDFSTQANWSTYDDTPGDEALAHFSIARDLAPNGTLSLIKRAQAAGFTGTIQAYMDYPPDWMLKGKLPDRATVDPKYYDALARYYAKFVSAYASHGVHIDFLEAFNEPSSVISDGSYTHMTSPQLATFLGEHLGPTFDKLGLRPRTQLTYGGQPERWAALVEVPLVMAHPAAREYMDLIAYHGYDCQFDDGPWHACSDERMNYDAIAKLRALFPTKQLWMTEICYAYNGDDPRCEDAATLDRCTDYPRNASLAPPLPRRDFGDGATWGERLVRELQAGASGWIYWNLLLDAEGGPFNLSPSHNDAGVNFQHPLVIVDTARADFLPTGLFRFLAHFSRFVRPGAVRLATTEHALPDGVSAVAFRPPSAKAVQQQQHAVAAADEVVLQLVNGATVPRCVAVCSGDGRVAQVELPPTSIATARW